MVQTLNVIERFQWRQSLLAAPAMFAIVAFGVVTGRVGEAATAAGAALSVGMVAGRSLGYFRWDSVLLVVFGTAIASALGSLAGENIWLYTLGAFIAAGGVGAGSLSHPQYWLIYLQMAVAFIVGGHFPSDLTTAISHSGTVLAGSMLQAAVVVSLGLLFPVLAQPMNPIAKHTGDVSPITFGVVAGLIVAVTLLAADRLGLSNVYWPAMTAMLILRPNLVHTQQRVVQRTVGTLAGCLIAFLIASIDPNAPHYIAGALMVAFAFTFAMQPSPHTNYGWFSGSVTVSVLLLLAFAQTDIVQDAELRLLSTILGATLAWLGALFLEFVLARPEPEAADQGGI